MKKFIILTYFLLTGIMVACQKFVDVGAPINNLISESVFESDETATSAMTGIYAKMLDNVNQTPLAITWYCGLAADELNTSYTNLSHQQLYTNYQIPETALTNRFWNGGYYFIYRTNAIVEGLKSSTKVSPAVKQQLLGEAYFIRSFWYFYLVNFYGNIPLILTTDYNESLKIDRTPTSRIYEQIIIDLSEAKKLLTENYVDANSVSSSVERIRPNTFTASALLSRVYLFTNAHKKAEEESTSIINNINKYTLEPAAKVYLKTSKEAIWQLARPIPAALSTIESEYFLVRARPGNTLAGSTTLSTQLVSNFKVSDLRYIEWVGKYLDNTVTPAKTYYFPAKYKMNGTSTPTEHSIPFRLAEQFLIRAEARTYLGNYSGAVEDLDMIRVRANQAKISTEFPTVNKENLLGIIMNERQVELFAEWGHRWLDLKRTMKIDDVMRPYSAIKGAKWESFMQLWPIPPADINNSQHLLQNPGYN